MYNSKFKQGFMIKNILVLSSGILLSNLLYAQKSIVAKADLQEVTVFSRAAELNHRAKVTLPSGTSEIVFTHVANNLDQNSIQIGAGPNVTVLSVRPATNYLETDSKTADYLQAERVYKKAQAYLKALENEKATEESMLKLLEENQRVARENSGSTVAELIKMTEYYKPKYLATKNTITSLDEKISDQQAQVNKAQVQFNEVKGQNSAAGGQLLVQVLANQAGNQDFQISYTTANAGWTAAYDLRAQDTKSPLQIVYKANVNQSTGVDWEKVKLRLSTSNPSAAGIAPTVQPWHLYYYQPNASAGYGELNEVVVVAHGVRTNDMAASPTAKRAVLNNFVQQNENQLSATFDIDIPYSIASNGRAHSVSLKEYSQAANYEYFVAPRQDQDVFLVAELTDYESLNLIPGQANVFLENMLVGKTYINPNEATDTLKLSLGRDKMIAVKREKLNDLSQTKTLGSSKRQTLAYEISIKNNKKTAVEITVKEQYPLSTDKSLEVNLDETSGASIDKETGILTWKVKVPAGSTQKLKFGYTLKYPKDKQVNVY